MKTERFRKILVDKGLKVTPRRLLILEAIRELGHPTTEEILIYVRKRHKDTATATVYKALNIMSDRKVICKVTIDGENGRYDVVMESHHHLYCPEDERIDDYFDEDLTSILKQYFDNKKIDGFKPADFKLQIVGRFIK